MIGFGAANIVPILFSAAGNAQGYAPGIAVAAVTTLGYAGQLAGPAMIGFIAYYIQLPFALGLLIIPMLAIAGSLASKKIVPTSAGTFPTDGGLFVGLVIGVILITGGLIFLPSLALGPVVEHFSLLAGTTY